MAKIKLAPIETEKEFVRLSKEMAKLAPKLEAVKKELLGYYEKGYSFSLVNASDTSGGVFSPPWKTLCLELLAKYMTPPQRKKWMLSLIKRFPRRTKAPTLTPLRKEAVNV